VRAVSRTPFLGLTGAIGAGKSEALAALGRLGAQTLSSDAVVHDLLATQRVRELLVGRWGPEAAPTGTVDRDRVAAIVFERPDELAWLESTLHPLVAERIASWRESLPDEAPAAVVEVPLLFETGMEDVFDATICVVASDAHRRERAEARGKLGLDGRAGRQLSQDEKAARATHVVPNDGRLEELEARLAELLERVAAGDGVP
jgi:dephospho-CoA kinase